MNNLILDEYKIYYIQYKNIYELDIKKQTQRKSSW